MPDASFTQSSPKSALVHKVYLAYHDASPLITSQILQPIHVGRALSAKALPGTIGDDSGENISSRNGVVAELSSPQDSPSEFCMLTSRYDEARTSPLPDEELEII